MNDDRARALQQHLLARAQAYFPEIGATPAQVQLLQTSRFRASTIYRFSLSAESLRRSLLAKAPAPNLREHMAEQTDSATKFRQEYQALAHIHAYFHGLADARFAAIRPLDFVADWHAIVMEEVRYPNLRDLFSKTSRLQLWSSPCDLPACFRNAGSWLRAFHAMPRPESAAPRDTTRADFVTLIAKYISYLQEAIGEEDFFRELAAHTAAAAARLPENFPLGLTHGDYALRNLLVGPQHCVLALDTQAKWLMPIYEDLAYFLVGLVTTWPQVLSQGLVFDPQDLAKFEHEFLRGYFASETIPDRAIRLFKIKIMLLKWSANVYRIQHGPAGLAAVRRRLMHRFYQKSLQQLLREQEAEP